MSNVRKKLLKRVEATEAGAREARGALRVHDKALFDLFPEVEVFKKVNDNRITGSTWHLTRSTPTSVWLQDGFRGEILRFKISKKIPNRFIFRYPNPGYSLHCSYCICNSCVRFICGVRLHSLPECPNTL